METKEELNQLFQKFVDKTINEEELERFYAYVKDPGNGTQFKQLLNELRGYFEMTIQTNSDDSAKENLRQLQRKTRLINELMEMNYEFNHRINTTIVKVLKGDYH